MKEFFSIIIAAALLLGAAACSRSEQTDVQAGTATDLPAADDGQVITAPSQGDTADAYNSIDSIDGDYVAELEGKAKSVMLLTKDIYAAAEKGDTLNVVLSEEVIEQIIDAIGAAGYSVIDAKGNHNMRNYLQVSTFGELVNAGQDAETIYYVVNGDGSLHMNALSFFDGAGEMITISVEWGDELEPAVYDRGRYLLKSVAYTDKGWLIIDRDISNYNVSRKFNVDSHTLVRVTPYDEACRALCQKYIAPVGYFENNLFTATWSENEYGDLDLNCLFPILYGALYDVQALNMYNAGDMFELIEDTYMHLIPADQFELVIKSYFNITSEQIRGLADFSESRSGYYMCAFQTGYYSVVPRTPVPEVVDYWYNSDGTLTLKVDAVFSWYGTDRAFTHEVTVRDTDSGFVYVSNYVYQSDANIFPDGQLYEERLRQIRWLDLQ